MLRSHRMGLGVAWLSAVIVQLALAYGTVDPPGLRQLCLELGGSLLIAGLHCWRCPSGWRGSVAWPGTLLLAAVALHGDRLALAGELLRAVGVVALAVVGVRVAHDLLGRRRLSPVLLGLWFSLSAGLSARFARLATAPVALIPRRLAEELTAPWHRQPRGGASGLPVIVITVDTLRTDRAATMHSLQRLAARGRYWPRALSSSSWTVPALASLWTGLPPAAHGAGTLASGPGFSSVGADVPLLAEQLADHGYVTAAFIANPFASTELGFSRGFQTWSSSDEHPGHPLILTGLRWAPRGRDGARVVDRALHWLDTAPDRGFLLWVHLFDPHVPYEHSSDPLAVSVQSPNAIRDGSRPADAALRTAVQAAYEGEVAEVDRQLDRLLDALEARALLDRGVVIFAADHGEELWEHGSFEHGHSHHAEVVDVPLVVVAPGLSPDVGRGVASLVDVAPTIRAAVGLPPDGLDLRSGPPPDRIATAAGNLYGDAQQSARSARRKVILTHSASGGETVVVYDADRDPTETQPLALETADAAAELGAARGALPAAGGTAAAVNTAALRALGYIE